nr:SIS domain-containing protein [bacterium]
GGKVLVCGNGGSAADSQHIAAELIGRFRRERRALPAVALTVDTSILTSLSNDYSFDRVFSRQVEALGSPGDVLLLISTSGNSANLSAAAAAAEAKGLKVIALLGRDGGALAGKAGVEIIVPAADTARIQESQQLVYHIICDLVEAAFS